MVNAKSRRKSSARLCLLLGALALFALLLTNAAAPAQADSHIEAHQGCSGTSASNPRVISPGVDASESVDDCFTDHSNVGSTFSAEITAVSGRTGSSHNYILTRAPDTFRQGSLDELRVKYTPKPASQLSQITPRLGSENTPGNFTFDYTLRMTYRSSTGSQALGRLQSP